MTRDNSIAWECPHGSGIRQFITQAQYDGFSPRVKAFYKPYRCASCATPTAQLSAALPAHIIVREAQRPELEGHVIICNLQQDDVDLGICAIPRKHIPALIAALAAMKGPQMPNTKKLNMTARQAAEQDAEMTEPDHGLTALIDLIGELGRETFYLLDDCEESGEGEEITLTVTKHGFDAVSGVLDRIEALPFEEDGCILGPGAKLQAAFKQLHEAAVKAAVDAEREAIAKWHDLAAVGAMNSLHCGSENNEYRAANRLHEFHKDCAATIRAHARANGGE